MISDTEVDACVDELKLADGPVLELEVFIFSGWDAAGGCCLLLARYA